MTTKTKEIDPKAGRIGDHPYGYQHVMTNQVALIPCGCEINGHGTLNSPVIIDFCTLHKHANRMLFFIKRLLTGKLAKTGIASLRTLVIIVNKIDKAIKKGK